MATAIAKSTAHQNNTSLTSLKISATAYTNHLINHSSTSTHNSYWVQTVSSSSTLATNQSVDLPYERAILLAIHLLKFNGIKLNDGSVLRIKDEKPFLEKDNQLHPVRKLHHKGEIDLSRFDNVLGSGVVLKTIDGSYIEIDENGGVVNHKYENASEKVINVQSDSVPLYESIAFNRFGDIHIPEGSRSNTKITLPNGTIISIESDETISIDDSNAKVLYKSQPIREFNKYLNASDLLEEFIKFCAEQKVTKKDFTDLPINMFILWLIVRAAEADEDPTDEVLPLLTTAIKKRKVHSHRCKCCGKFLTKKYEIHQISFCNTDHMETYLSKI